MERENNQDNQTGKSSEKDNCSKMAIKQKTLQLINNDPILSQNDLNQSVLSESVVNSLRIHSEDLNEKNIKKFPISDGNKEIMMTIKTQENGKILSFSFEIINEINSK